MLKSKGKKLIPMHIIVKKYVSSTNTISTLKCTLARNE